MTKTPKQKVRPFPRTDAGNAELFAYLYRDDVRYDHQQGRWLIWTGQRWTEDREQRVRTLAKRVARLRLQSAACIGDDGARRQETQWAFQSEMRNRLDATLELAKSEDPISDPGSDWDANPWLLGAANGVVDLKSGRLRPEKLDDRITKHSPVSWDATAACPRFEQFLDQVFGSDADLIRFVQKALGYSITGQTTEQCVFCCYGSGANGKSTLLSLVSYVLGDYAANLPFSALELSGRSNIGNDLVLMYGRRFVTSIETQEGIRLNEARMKAVTGSDAITGRRLYHEHFQFDPTHKIWLAFNHKPVITDDSEGMWRRIMLIPFIHQFCEAQRDKDLLLKLKQEAPGVLSWIVRGCLLWQREGLKMPTAIAQATSSFRTESDHLGQFIGECCVTGDDRSVTSADLWEAYQRWTVDSEEMQLGRGIFAKRMERREFRRSRNGHCGTRVWLGIAVRADTLTSTDADSAKSPLDTVI